MPKPAPQPEPRLPKTARPKTARPAATTPPKPSGADPEIRAAFTHLSQTLRSLEDDLRWGLQNSARIPADWHRIAAAETPPRKTRLSLRLDEDVVRFFCAMGPGHTTRMNAVLRAFMQARLAHVIKGPEDAAEARALALLMEHSREMEEYDRLKPELERRATHGPNPQEAMAELNARLDRIQHLTLRMMG